MSNRMNRLAISDRLGDRYCILSILGTGGMSAVYLAEDMKLQGKKWAIKESVKSPLDFQQFIDEAEILVKLNHPHLPNIIDYFPPDSEGYSYLVMDYIPGQTLMQYFQSLHKEMSHKKILKYSIQLCDLFAYLHKNEPKPIIYRDLKPSNVMIDQQDNVRLIDFGTARNYQRGQQLDTIPLGTIGFAAPEQFEQLQTDHRTDLYNLGAMMYFLLSKGHYYYMTQQSIASFTKDIPEGLIKVVDKLLMPKPEDRYQSADHVKREIEGFVSSVKIESVNEVHQQPLMQNKTIVIGSLYNGAGSTFLSIALARAFNHFHLPNAVVEYPTIAPELFGLLNGERVVPKNYIFLVDQLRAGYGAEQRRDWSSGTTTWYPISPTVNKPINWNEDHSYRLLYTVKCPMVIIDVSDHWQESGVKKMCMEADEIIFVADSFPHKFNSDSCEKNLEYACQLKDLGKSVDFVANRLADSFPHREWLHSFPWSPLCNVPNISYEEVIRAAWKGQLSQDQPKTMIKLLKSLQPLLKRYVPKAYLHVHRSKAQSGILSFLKKPLVK